MLSHPIARRPDSGADRPRWVEWATILAAITVGYNLVEGLVSMSFGWADDSLALFGFGADSFIEVGSALLIFWRLRGEARCHPVASVQRERTATRGIGAMFLLLGLGTAAGAVVQILERDHPDTTLPGAIVALLSLSFMVVLWREKSRAAEALASPAVRADAACSLACIQLSVVLLAGSLVYLLAPALWWVDALAALVLSLFFAREGVATLRAAARPDFAGGCGCH